MLVDDALQIIDTLQRRHPGVEMVLMGESMGGAVLMDLATRPTRPMWPAMCSWPRRCGAGRG